MNHIQILTISYECEASLGNSLNLQDMTKNFLKIFLKKTSALYATIIDFENIDGISVLNSVGKKEFLDTVLYNTIDMTQKYTIIDVVKDFDNYKILYMPLQNHYLAFVFSTKNNLDINIVANIFSSLKNKIELGIRASLEHEKLESEALFKTNNGLWEWNFLKNSIYFSPRFKKMLGYEYDEFENEIAFWKNKIYPDDLKNMTNTINLYIEKKIDSYKINYRIKNKNEEWIWILDKHKICFNKDKKAIAVIGHIKSITYVKEKF